MHRVVETANVTATGNSSKPKQFRRRARAAIYHGELVELSAERTQPPPVCVQEEIARFLRPGSSVRDIAGFEETPARDDDSFAQAALTEPVLSVREKSSRVIHRH
jgi:hypothetical protein